MVCNLYIGRIYKFHRLTWIHNSPWAKYRNLHPHRNVQPILLFNSMKNKRLNSHYMYMYVWNVTGNVPNKIVRNLIRDGVLQIMLFWREQHDLKYTNSGQAYFGTSLSLPFYIHVQVSCQYCRIQMLENCTQKKKKTKAKAEIDS